MSRYYFSYFCAAAQPASTAAFTAPTSPRTITVYKTGTDFSGAFYVTLAAFTIASAASIAPTKPFVSTVPNALFMIISFIFTNLYAFLFRVFSLVLFFFVPVDLELFGSMMVDTISSNTSTTFSSNLGFSVLEL